MGDRPVEVTPIDFFAKLLFDLTSYVGVFNRGKPFQCGQSASTLVKLFWIKLNDGLVVKG